jgi:tetratricopeptide (TPR) repeat protein
MNNNSLLGQARAAYLDARYGQALALNEKAIHAGELLGHRYVGVCLYRLNQLKRSEQALRRAQTKLPPEQQPYLCNHLGATLRSLGKLDEAERVLLDGLKAAEEVAFADARGRLHGSIGALYDELGLTHRAVEHYARFEELMRLHGSKLKLANAVGLVARQAIRHGDLDRAEELGKEELKIGLEYNKRSLIISARVHLAHVASMRGNAARGSDSELAELYYDEARELYQLALSDADSIELLKRQFSTRRSLGRFETEVGRLAEARKWLDEALVLSMKLPAHDQARAFESLARCSSAAGLHGEALHFMQQAVVARRALTETHPKLMEARTRRTEELTREMVEEALAVTRSPKEMEHLKEVLPDWEKKLSEGVLPHWQWLQDAEREAEKTWTARLLDDWEALPVEVRGDLVQAHTLYRSAKDLGVVAFLLARGTERLLREVVAGAKGRGKPTLNPLLKALKNPGIERLLTNAVDAEDREQDLVQLRNDFAHGNPMDIDRLGVDCLIRVVATGPDSVLSQLLALPRSKG